MRSGLRQWFHRLVYLFRQSGPLCRKACLHHRHVESDWLFRVNLDVHATVLVQRELAPPASRLPEIGIADLQSNFPFLTSEWWTRDYRPSRNNLRSTNTARGRSFKSSRYIFTQSPSKFPNSGGLSLYTPLRSCFSNWMPFDLGLT